MTGTFVDVRLVVRKALELGAVALLVAHNHPSGSLKPSSADRQITQRLVKALAYFDMRLLDHLIITKEKYYSFADRQLL
jgi:DNA repair protein RadC